jgi:hypothetical protein
MGIPGFSSWLTKQYPKIKTVLQEDERNTGNYFNLYSLLFYYFQDNRNFHHPVDPIGIRLNVRTFNIFFSLYFDVFF